MRSAPACLTAIASLLICLLAPALAAGQSVEKIHEVGGRVHRPMRISGTSSSEVLDALNANRGPFGIIIFRAVIRRDGSVGDFALIRPRKLAKEIETALRREVESWRFKPATLDGHPVAVHYTMTLNVCPH